MVIEAVIYNFNFSLFSGHWERRKLILVQLYNFLMIASDKSFCSRNAKQQNLCFLPQSLNPTV